MDLQELSRLLRQSLADWSVAPGEKTALPAWIERHVRDERTRALAQHAAFEAARTAIAEPAAGRVVEWLESVMQALASSGSSPVAGASGSHEIEHDSACFSPGESCLNRVIHRFDECRRAAELCVFTITDDRISRAILDAHRRGVKLRILSDHAKSGDLGSDMREFIQAGIAVKLADVFTRTGPRHEGHMHHKFAIFDGERLINGSYNWTRGAANVNFENLVDTANPDLVSVFAEEFTRLWNRF